MENIYKKLTKIQNEMKVPKNLYNKFGGYNYRNAETILDVAKPLCEKYGCTLIVGDEIVQIGERYYVRATAMLFDSDSDGSIGNTAYAREEESKKGMDGSQVTGSCSSYARKYALNGLFCLDDVKDADSNELAQETTKGKATDVQLATVRKLITNEENCCKAYGVAKLEDLTSEQALDIISKKS